MTEHSGELEIRPEGQVTLFGSQEPTQVIEKVSEIAGILKDVLRKQKLVANIKGREHILVEGWVLLGTLLGVFPVVMSAEELRDETGKLLGFEARCEARTRAGETVGAAVARCMRSERTWKDRDEYALQSMAQTRATSKALRGPLGFVVTIAGYEATPAEEMPEESDTVNSAPFHAPSNGQAEDPDEQAPSPSQIKAFENLFEKVYDHEPVPDDIPKTKKDARMALQEMSALLTKSNEPDPYG